MTEQEGDWCSPRPHCPQHEHQLGAKLITATTTSLHHETARLIGAAVIYAGAYDVAATDAHWPATRWVLDVARRHSVAAHAKGIEAPADLDKPETLALGVSHFAAHCAICHGAPGVSKDDIAAGMYPAPPDLAVSAQQYSPAELFWILRHGLKMSGMPAWPDRGDEDLWAITSFLKKLPGMTEPQYAKLVMENAMHGMIHHHGGEEGDARPAVP